MNEKISIKNVLILIKIIIPKIEKSISIDFGNKTFYRHWNNFEKNCGVYKIDNADLSNEIIVKSIWLVRGFQSKLKRFEI